MSYVGQARRDDDDDDYNDYNIALRTLRRLEMDPLDGLGEGSSRELAVEWCHRLYGGIYFEL